MEATSDQLSGAAGKSGRRLSLITKSFLPFAGRFVSRHPTKLSRLREYWQDYIGRFANVGLLTGRELDLVEQLFYEVECEQPLFRDINRPGLPIYPAIYYVLVRLMQPRVVVETGVSEGLSSLFLLLAMERNNLGTLHSIDLPEADFELGPGLGRQTAFIAEGDETGWRVPAGLRARWRLHLGNARDLLPQILKTVGEVDLFIHDSLHSYEHMLFEFQTAWPYLKEGGIVLSDDTDWNNAFRDFTAAVQCRPVMFNYRVGGVRKPFLSQPPHGSGTTTSD